MDWTSSKKVLLDEYRELYPGRTKEEEAAFYTAMTWLENEMSLEAAKERVLQALDEKNPGLDKRKRAAFIYGLERMGMVLNESSGISDRLNDYLPERVHNEYLRKTLEGVRELVARNEQLKSERDKAVNIMETFKTMSNSDKSKLRRDMAYQERLNEIDSLKEEIKQMKEERDIYLYRWLKAKGV